MTEDKKSSVGGGMICAYALMAVILLTLSSGCMGGQTGYTVYTQYPPATSAKENAQNPAAPAATQATVLVILSKVDFSQVSVSIDGCADDVYNNSMIAGYVTNNGVKTMDAVPIVTQLLTPEGVVVSGGEKTTTVNNLKPGETQKFSATYVTPPPWKKCRASVNGNWPTG